MASVEKAANDDGPDFGDLDLSDKGLAVVAPEDMARAEVYGLLAALLRDAPTAETMNVLRGLDGTGGVFAESITDITQIAQGMPEQDARAEYDALFVGLGRGELLPYASYYLTGFLNEKPLAKLRDAMSAMGAARADDRVEPEDHIGSVCELMAGVITGAFGPPADLDAQAGFYRAHLEPWAGVFFSDLETAKTARLYRAIGAVGRKMIEIETEGFRLHM